MRFMLPIWLWLLPLLLAAGVAVWARAGREYRRRAALFLGPQVLLSLLGSSGLKRLRLRLALLLCAVGALLVALARPLGRTSQFSSGRNGINLLIALDGSRSMLAEDVAPNRFALARKGIDSLLRSMSGDRAGLLLFAGQSTLVAPLTFDTVSLQLIANSLDPDLAGRGGSSLSETIKRAVEYFEKRPGTSRVLVIFSDGEETEGDAVVAAQNAFHKHGLRIFTVGTGKTEGATIPRFEISAQRERTRSGSLRDDQGAEIRTRLDEAVLRAITEVAGGAYVNLDETHGDLRAFYTGSLRPLATVMDETTLADSTEWFQLPLALALAALGAAAFPRTGKRVHPSATVAAGLCLAACVLGSQSTQAGTMEAQQLLAAGEPAKAFALLQAALLKTPDDPISQYNYGVGAYSNERYAAAIDVFESLTPSADSELSTRSAAHLGNCHYRLGEAARAKNPEGTAVHWERALAAYQKAPGNPLAEANRQKTRHDLLSLWMSVSSDKITAGDTAARLSLEKGVPSWREALGLLDKAAPLAQGNEKSAEVSAASAAVSERIHRAFITLGNDKQRRAQLQHRASLDRAIELMAESVAHFEDALGLRPGDSAAQTARDRALSTLDPWRVELGDRLHQEGQVKKSVSLSEAVATWTKAAVHYATVLAHAPTHAGALAGRDKNNAALVAAHLGLGDLKRGQAADAARAPAERDALLEQSLDHYESALRIEPGNTPALEKRNEAGRALAGMLVSRGFAELSQGKLSAREKVSNAVAALERAVQSFGKALRFIPTHAEAQAGRKEAVDLLRSLRDLDAHEQRRVLGSSKDLNDARDLENPGELALKLLDFQNDQLSSKRQQNLSAPENRPTRDW